MQSRNKHHIVVVGAGVVGYATGRGFAKKGNRVTFVDVNCQRIEELRQEGAHAFQAHEVNWSDCDIVMLAVSTPTKDGAVFLDHIKSAAADVGKGLRDTDKFIPVVVRSTVSAHHNRASNPSYSRRKIQAKISGVDFWCCYEPRIFCDRKLRFKILPRHGSR